MEFKVYEVDYHDRAFLIGTADTLKEANKIKRSALKRSNNEFPVFIDRQEETNA